MRSSSDPISLIKKEKALAKIIESKAGDDQHWIFLLKQLKYPQCHRPVHKLATTSDRNQVYNPSSNIWMKRKANPNRGRFKETQFTKKTATTLLPNDGCITLYNPTGINIGILFNLDFCKLHGDTSNEIKYAFLSNQITNNRWWIKGQPDSNNVTQSIQLEQIINFNRTERKENKIPFHNEILARLSKQAVAAIFTRKDYVTDRINAYHKKFLVFHWLQVDVPVLYMAPGYKVDLLSEDQMINDILEVISTKKSRDNAYDFVIELLRFINLYNKSLWNKLNNRISEINFEDIPIEYWLCKNVEDNNQSAVNKIYSQLAYSSYEKIIAWADFCAQNNNFNLSKNMIAGLIRTKQNETKETKTNEIEELLLTSIKLQYFRVAKLLLSTNNFNEKLLKEALQYLIAYNQHEHALMIFTLMPNAKFNSQDINLKSTLEILYQSNISTNVLKKYLVLIIENFDKNPNNYSQKDLGMILCLLYQCNMVDKIKMILVEHPEVEMPYKQETILHNIVNDEKPDAQLFSLFYGITNPYQENGLAKTPFLIAAEKNINAIIETCLEDKNISKNSFEQLDRVMIQFIKNNKLNYAETLFLKFKKFGLCNFSAYEDMLIRWLKHPNLQITLLDLISKHAPYKITQEFYNYSSYLGYLCALNKPQFFKLFLQNDDFLKQLKLSQFQHCLHYLIQHEHFDDVVFMLKNSNHVLNYVDEQLNTALHYTLSEDKPNLDLVKLIYKRSSCKYQINKENKSPLVLAAEKNIIEVIEMYLEDKENISSIRHSQAEQIILNLLKYNNLTQVDKFFKILKNSKDFNVAISNLLNSYLSADLLKLIVQNKPQIIANKYGKMSSYMEHLCYQNNSLYKTFLQSYVVMNLLTPVQLGACIHWLVANKHYEDACYIIKNHQLEGLNEKLSLSHNTDLHLTVLEDKPDLTLINLLFLNSKFLGVENKNDKTAFLIAVEKNNNALIHIFLQDLRHLSSYKTTQLEKIIARLIINNRLKEAEILLKYCENQAFRSLGKLIFHIGKDISLPVVEIILKYSPRNFTDSVVIDNNEYSSYLHFLVSQDMIKLTEIILENKAVMANLNENQLGMILIHLMKNNHVDTIKNWIGNYPHLKIYAGYIFPDTNNTALHFAVLENNPDLELVKILLKDNTNVCFENSNKQTPFLLVAQKNHDNLIPLFISQVNQINQYTPNQLKQILSHLIAHSHYKAVDFILKNYERVRELKSFVTSLITNPQPYPPLYNSILSIFSNPVDLSENEFMQVVKAYLSSNMLINEEKRESKHNQSDLFNHMEFLSNLGENCSNYRDHGHRDYFLTRVKKVIHYLLSISTSPDEIVKIISRLQTMPNVFNKFYRRCTTNGIFSTHIWQNMNVESDWIDLVNAAKSRIISLIKECDLNLQCEQVVVDFLKTPTLKNTRLLCSSLSTCPYYKQYTKWQAEQTNFDDCQKINIGPFL